MFNLHKILVIQTAFIGDVILATAVLEKIHQFYPQAELHFLVRQGNENLLTAHPFVHRTWVWNKKNGKYQHLWELLRSFRTEKFDAVINLQRFANSGLLTAFSKAPIRVGFDKNPLSFLFSHTVRHEIGKNQHEVARNLRLVEFLTDSAWVRPRLYPTPADYAQVRAYQTEPYLCLAPASVWYTKQFPTKKWIEFLQQIDFEGNIYLLGAPSDRALTDTICQAVPNRSLTNLTGKLNLLASAALMEKARMNYVNDSAPLHLASAVNAPVCAIFCSTTPDFGFTPLSDRSVIVQTEQALPCRPCGLHGKKACPEGHFACASTIRPEQLNKLWA